MWFSLLSSSIGTVQFEIRTCFASELLGLDFWVLLLGGLWFFLAGGVTKGGMCLFIGSILKVKGKKWVNCFRRRKWKWKVIPYLTTVSTTFVLSKGLSVLDHGKIFFLNVSPVLLSDWHYIEP